MGGARLRTLVGILGVAAAYFVAGRLALLLAIPPGYATAVWPAAGVAWVAVLLFGYRLLPGVWLGSFLVNVGTSFHGGGVLEVLGSCLLPASIGLGATLQAGISAVLVRRWVGYPNALERDSSIALFLGIGAPLGCLVGATWGVGSLYLAGAITGGELAFSWLTWWAGDAIGVLLVAPPALGWLGEPRPAWRLRKLALSVPVSLLFVAAVLLFVRLSGWEQQKVERELEVRARVLGHLLSAEVTEQIEIVHALRAHLEGLPDPGPTEFARFVAPALARHPSIHALEWAPRVPDRERERIERAARRAGLAGYRIRESAPDGSLVSAGPRPEYVPVLYVEPQRRNRASIGFDLASNPTRREALARARDSGGLSVTDRVRLVQETEDQYGFLVIAPVYRAGPEPSSVAERRQRLRGYALAVLRARDLLEAAVVPGDVQGLRLRLESDAAAPQERLLAVFSDAPRQDDGSPASGALRPARISFELAGRQFTLTVEPTAAYLAEARSLQAWAVLVGALLFIGLLSVFLLSITGRAAEVRREVELRTAELDAARGELERSNRDLEQFAYAISHDLQAPLRTVRGFLDLFRRRHEAELDEQGRHFIATAAEGAEKMTEMIRGLLSYAKMGGALTGVVTRIDANQAVQEALSRLQAAIEESHASVSVAPLPPLRGDPAQLTLVFQNLLSNAIKYRGQEPPVIRIEAVDDPAKVRISVSDNGMGFPPDQAGRIFDVFRRLPGAAKSEGSGIGLALVRRVVEQRGGRIWAESTALGSTFHFTWPRAEAEPFADQS